MADGIGLAEGQETTRATPPKGKKATFIQLTNAERGRSYIAREEPLPLMSGLFIADTFTLSAEQRSAYILLLLYAWRQKSPLPDDDGYLSRVAGMSRTKFRLVFRPVADQFFEIADGYWRPNAGHIFDPQSQRLPQDEWKTLRLKIFARDNHTCIYCGERGGKLECDHVIPITRGGSNDPDNLATSCRDCNRKKGCQTVEEWLGNSLTKKEA